MSDRARINIIGRLAQKPEVKKNEAGKQYVIFAVASNYYDPYRKQQLAMFFSCIAGERHLSYLQGAEVGDKVDLTGKLTPNMYTDRKGVTHDNYNVLADDIDITRKPTGGAPASAGQQRPQQARPQAAAEQQYNQQSQNGQNQYQRQSQQISAPQPQKQNGYFYERNPFDGQQENEDGGFRPATYSY